MCGIKRQKETNGGESLGVVHMGPLKRWRQGVIALLERGVHECEWLDGCTVVVIWLNGWCLIKGGVYIRRPCKTGNTCGPGFFVEKTSGECLRIINSY